MKKAISLGMILSLIGSMAVFGAETESTETMETEFIPTYEQTASARLDQNGNEVNVTVDLTGGWSVEFAAGAVYLYEGKVDENELAAVIGLTLEEEVFNEYVADAPDRDNYREFARSFSYTEEDGWTDYFFSVGSDAYFMVSVNPEAECDPDEASSRISVEPSHYYGETEGE